MKKNVVTLPKFSTKETPNILNEVNTKKKLIITFFFLLQLLKFSI